MSEIIKKNIIIGLNAGKSEFHLEDLVNEVQSFCLGLRLEHWKTTSYELHKAVEMTQASLEDALDAFVEACVGSMDGVRPVFNEELSATTDEKTLIEYLKNITTRETDLLNIRDEMLQALHKFVYLKTLK
jgi:hypothetical protein